LGADIRWKKKKEAQTMRTDAPRFSAREAIARSYPTWDNAMADRLIAWLDHCGYAIVEKGPRHDEASLVPAAEEHAANRLQQSH
jgi:hypothetical protein